MVWLAGKVWYDSSREDIFRVYDAQLRIGSREEEMEKSQLQEKNKWSQGVKSQSPLRAGHVVALRCRIWLAKVLSDGIGLV